MKQYTVYDLESGEIARCGICNEIDFDAQAQTGQGVIEGYFTSNVAFVLNQKIVLYTEAQKLTKSKQPSYNCVWDNKTFEWIDLRSGQQKFDEASASVKSVRNQLLAESDWTQIADVPLSNKQEWSIYRQALRDIPEQPGYPFNVSWPSKPE